MSTRLGGFGENSRSMNRNPSLGRDIQHDRASKTNESMIEADMQSLNKYNGSIN